MKIRGYQYTKKEMAAHNGVDVRFWGNELPKIEGVPEGWDNHMHTQQLYRKSLNLDELHVEYRNGILVYVFEVSEEDAEFLQLEYVKKYEEIAGVGGVPTEKETGEVELHRGSHFVYNDFRRMEDENPVTITYFSQNLAITKYFMRKSREMSIPVYTEREFDYLSSGAGGYRHFDRGTFTVQAAIIKIKEEQ